MTIHIRTKNGSTKIRFPFLESSTYGYAMGSALAMTVSWSINHSILWAIAHGACSWFYILYFALNR